MGFDYSSQVNAKLAALAAIDSPVSGQVVAIHWAAPVGVRYYVPADYRLMPEQGFNKISDILDPAKIYVKLAPNNQSSDWRLELKNTGGLSDDSISIELGDIDQEITNIYYTFGADCLVEVFRWIPQVELLVNEWWGFLDAPSSIEPEKITFNASIGVRSSRSQFPHRLRGAPGCQAAGFGGRFATQDEVNECGCPYNNHLSGSIGISGFTDCPQLEVSDCTARLGTDQYWLGTELTADGRTAVFAGAYLSANSQVKGNSTRSNQPFAVHLGGNFTAYEMGVLDMIADTNTKHPEAAARRVLADFSEGPIQGISDVYIDGKFVQPQHFQLRLGEQGQPPSGFVGNVNNYSLLAHASMATFGNDPSATADSIRIRGTFSGGYSKQRIYSAPNVFSLGSTNIRAWNLRTVLTQKLWGAGDAHGLYVDQDWIDLAATDQENLSFTDRHGESRNCKRSSFAHYFNQPQPEDEVIKQICLWGGYTPRIQFDGKYRITRLDKKPDLNTVPELFAYPHDGGIEANICAVSGSDLRTSLRLEQPVNPRDLTYQVNVSFCDESIAYKQRTITIEDRNAQTNQGRNLGEYRFRQGSKQYFALGITNEAEVIYHAEQILFCGEFFSGGLRCNQPISFNVWWKTDLLLKLHEFQVIKVDSFNQQKGRPFLPTKLDGMQRFDYYIILKKIRLRNNQVKLICQAYDETFFDRENVTITPPVTVVGDTPYPYPYEPANPIVIGGEIQFGFQQV
jgi:hypothetical protein